MNPRVLVLTVLLIGLLFILAGCEEDCGPNEPCAECIPETEWREVQRLSSQYVDNRFFFPDLRTDWPGRDEQTEFINPWSIMVFMHLGVGALSPMDLGYVAVYEDVGGRWEGIDFQAPAYHGYRWQQLELNLRLDYEGNVVNVDIGQSVPDDAVLGIIYQVVDSEGELVYKVGDVPGLDQGINLPGEDDLYLRMKLLKGKAADQFAHPFWLERQNIYDMGIRNVIPEDLDLTIEWNTPGENLDVDETGISYLRIFGLDTEDATGNPGFDGLPDFHNQELFDLEQGLLFFPLGFPKPFASSAGAYEMNVSSNQFVWWGSYLQENQTPEIYDVETNPDNYDQYSPFVFKFRVKQE